jgi:fumarate hydratase class II
MTDIRKETDSLGEVDVPADKLWGEKAAANANHASGRLDAYLQASASLRTSQVASK